MTTRMFWQLVGIWMIPQLRAVRQDCRQQKACVCHPRPEA